ncbi:MAG: YkgJ family cysteine cluster protein, partial [Candidatus Riflebacteria bacterium]|nr:YkgJ family cysteine cluster protein [Candidatus Riflebacteria bacterium]
MASREYRFPGEHRHSCEGCGRCCHHMRIPVTPELAASIRAAVGKPHGRDDPFEVDRRTGGMLIRQVGTACVFLEKGNVCVLD